jgi:hypothetical protein
LGLSSSLGDRLPAPSALRGARIKLNVANTASAANTLGTAKQGYQNRFMVHHSWI